MGRVTRITAKTLEYNPDIPIGTERVLLQQSYYAQGSPQAGHLQSQTGADGRSLSYDYDPAGGLTRIQLPDQQHIDYRYNSLGQLSQIIPPGREAYLFDYNAAGDPERSTPPVVANSSSHTQYHYNRDRELQRIQAGRASQQHPSAVAILALPRTATRLAFNRSP